jgi:hypothetical protein
MQTRCRANSSELTHLQQLWPSSHTRCSTMGVPGLLALLREHCEELDIPRVDLAQLGSANAAGPLILATDGYALLFYLLSGCVDTASAGECSTLSKP